MTEPFDEYGDRLRRALHAEADAVVPSPEGLDQIRTKISKRREQRLWFALPWLRPVMAVAAALFIAVAAVSTTPAIRNFVQTGHLSPDHGNDQAADSHASSDDSRYPGSPHHNPGAGHATSMPSGTTTGNAGQSGTCASMPPPTPTGPTIQKQTITKPAPTCHPPTPPATNPANGHTTPPTSPNPPTSPPPIDKPTSPPTGQNGQASP